MNEVDGNTPQKRNLSRDIKILESLQLPQSCPWSIEVRPLNDTNDTLEVLLTQGEKTFNLSELCPQGFRGFKYGEKDQYNLPDATITFSKRTQDSQYFLLTLLHEIGHSNSDTHINMVFGINQRRLDIVFKILRYEKAGKWKKVFLKRPNIDLLEEETTRLDETTRREVYREERHAWSYALQKMRELQREGFHISQGCNLRAAQNFITLSLLSYELNRDPLGQYPTIIKKINRKVFRTIYGDK